ncbi:fimbrial protein [Klebsiella michiganensis]|uniref:fimbrial protein n=1 Tax=Klebsiella michiganensis TaxID=1134687 RepID=UPI003F5067BC
MLLMLLLSWRCAANDVTLEFKYTVVAATCTVTPPPTVQIGAGAGSDLDVSALVDQAWQFVGATPFAVAVNCKGTPDAGTAPYVTVTPKGTTAASATGVYRDSTSTSTGLGIVLANTASKTNAAVTLSSSNLIKTGANTIKLEASGAPTTTTYWLTTGVACGDAAACAASKLSPGALKATFTLDVEYK